jgi:acylphosphatase
MVQYEIRIAGRVQGVGFRYFVQRRASEFDISGWVMNQPDGSVLVMAQGNLKDMEPFIDHLRTGPSSARVTQFIKSEMPSLENFTGFQVRY